MSVRLPRARHPRDPEGRMTLVEHLQELRSRVLKSVLALAAGSIGGYFLFGPIFDVLKAPYCHLSPAARGAAGQVAGPHTGCYLYQFSVFEAFGIRLHVALLAGAVLSAPIWLYQLWSFITPGLRRHERRFALGFVGASLLLFAGGGTLAFFFLHKALGFLLRVAGTGVAPVLSISNYLNFVTLMLVVFGLSFEFPLIVVLLNFAGVLHSRRLRSWRRMEIFLVFAFAAVATPSPDPLTMTALAVPICLLYEVAVLVAVVHDRRKAAREAASPFAGLDPDAPSRLDLPSGDLPIGS